MNEIKNMDIATLIAECTAYDFKEVLESGTVIMEVKEGKYEPLGEGDILR